MPEPTNPRRLFIPRRNGMRDVLLALMRRHIEMGVGILACCLRCRRTIPIDPDLPHEPRCEAREGASWLAAANNP